MSNDTEVIDKFWGYVAEHRRDAAAQAALAEAAAQSYTRLAARLNADPLKLAEADVLGLLWEYHQSGSRALAWSGANRRIETAIDQCRQPATKE